MTGIRWAGFALGFALGGFADGILFHQVLQWHHLISLVDLPVFATLEGQVCHIAAAALANAGASVLLNVPLPAGCFGPWRTQIVLGS